MIIAMMMPTIRYGMEDRGIRGLTPGRRSSICGVGACSTGMVKERAISNKRRSIMAHIATKQRMMPIFAKVFQKFFGLAIFLIIFFPRGVLHIRTGPQKEKLCFFNIPWVFIR
jgi:hypothetical protein